MNRRRLASKSFHAPALLLIAALTLLPLPARAQTAEPLPVQEVAPGIFVFQGAYQLFTPKNKGAICNVGFVIGRDAVAVIDTGGSVGGGQRLRAAIEARTKLPVRYVINTHMHPDHIFGSPAFESASPQFVGHAKLARALAARGDYYISANRRLLGEEAAAGLKIIPPTLPVEKSLDLDLGGRILRLTAHPTAHTDNDLTVLDLETRTLFTGDLLFARHIPTLDGSLKGWLKVLETLQSWDVARVVSGHGPVPMPWPQAAGPELRYLNRLKADVLAAIKAGKTLADASATAGVSERDAWELFDDFNARNVAAAFAEMEWE